MKKIHGGEIVVRMLAAEGVEKVFGIIDGTYFGLYSNLKKHGIDLVTPRHETSAAHMAGAYARTTGRLGVCIASNGPGVANVLPGVATENAEGNRVLLITSCRREGIAYPDRGGAYQYFNQVAATRPMTKWSGAVPSRDRIGELMRRAFRLSFRGRPGVVHVDVPESILNGKDRFEARQLRPPERYRRTAVLEPAAGAVRQAAEMLCAARRPMIHAGSGVVHAGASGELARLAAILEAPVTTSWGGRAALAETSPHAISMIHLDLVQRVRNDADLVLALGTRFGETDWWGKAPYWAPAERQRVIQVDVDEEILGLNKPVDLAVLGDAKRFLARLTDELGEHALGIDAAARRQALAGYREELRKSRAALDGKARKGGAEGTVHPADVPILCQEAFPDDTIWVFDGGNTAVWANFYHQVRCPNALLSTFKFGMLGAGISQAIGAKAAHPGRAVCCILGDGAMGFHLQEIETAVRARLPVVSVVVCDRQWGMVKMNQQFALKPVKTLLRRSLSVEETINADLGEIEFDRVARAMGAHGERVSERDDLAPALERCLAEDRPSVVHVDVDRVAHMWAPGLLKFKAMHQEPGGK